MTSDSKRALAVFFAAIVVVCGFFEFMAVHYNGGTYYVMWGVTIATLLTFRVTRRSLRSLGWGWGSWRYQWIAYLVPLGYTLVAYLIVWGAGFGGFPNPGFAAHVRERFGLTGWSDLAALAYFLPLTAFFGMPNSMSSALGEEIGWRGFLVPELARSMSFSAVALTTGIIWAAWHLPVILLGNYHNNSQAALPRWGQVVMFFIGVVSAAVIMAYLRLKSGSLWTGAVFHASHNMFIQTVFNPLTIQYHDTAKYTDELGLVLPLTMVPVAIYFFVRGRREFAEGKTTNP
jgi:membrane protease YdiL (CAAX protease family)